MKKLFLVLSVVLALVVLVPSAALAADIPLHNPGPGYDTDGEWHFLINQLNSEADAPATIHIVWSDGSEDDIPFDGFTGGVAHYYLAGDAKDPGVYPTGGTAVVNQEGWSGNFNLSHGPTPPVPELPVVALMGVGLAGLGAFVFLKRRTLMAKLT